VGNRAPSRIVDDPSFLRRPADAGLGDLDLISAGSTTVGACALRSLGAFAAIKGTRRACSTARGRAEVVGLGARVFGTVNHRCAEGTATRRFVYG